MPPSKELFTAQKGSRFAPRLNKGKNIDSLLNLIGIREIKQAPY
jgi:hypothetical protein